MIERMKVGRLLSDNTFIPGGVYDCSLPEQTFFMSIGGLIMLF